MSFGRAEKSDVGVLHKLHENLASSRKKRFMILPHRSVRSHRTQQIPESSTELHRDPNSFPNFERTFPDARPLHRELKGSFRILTLSRKDGIVGEVLPQLERDYFRRARIELRYSSRDGKHRLVSVGDGRHLNHRRISSTRGAVGGQQRKEPPTTVGSDASWCSRRVRL